MQQLFSDRKWWLALVVYMVLGDAFVVAQPDQQIFTYESYIDNILRYHPIAEKADLKTRLAEAESLSAKGGLDPKLSFDWRQKDFDDKLYYQVYEAGIKVPTALGVDLKAGYENTKGEFLNPENKTSSFGLWHFGVEVNALQGLIVNERRTALQQAAVFQDLAANERNIVLNELIYNGTLAYLNWQQYEYFDEILTENLSLAATYLQNVKTSFQGGEKTAVDTLEAFILYQDAVVAKQKNQLSLIKSRQNLENFIWYDGQPAGLRENIKPEDYKSEILKAEASLDEVSIATHPAISATINKLSILEIEQRLKREKMKPKLKLKYNPLLATSDNSVAPTYSINDYKIGVNFSTPLLFMNERANVQKGKIKIEDTKLDLEIKRNELQNKIESSWLRQRDLIQQITLMADNVENYKLLLEAEREKFRYGESSVFLLNKRQEKYIGGQLKLIKIYGQRQLELLNFLYYSNQLLD